jgi:HAD superfamily hydrolase (TIGR01509 family)
MEPEAGLVEALSVLSQARPLAIATNRGFSMPQILEHFSLSGFFSVVVTSRDVARPKPHPDMLFEAARQLELPVDRLLFIGDSELDFAAASAAGMPFAAYRQALDADCRLESHLQLVDLFAGS